MANIVDKIYEKTTRNDKFAIGSAISAFRNPILGVIEIVAGMRPEDSANLRMCATMTNFFITGPVWEWGRKILHKKIGIKKESSDEAKIWSNRLYGSGTALLEVSANYGIYKLFGARDIWEAGIPALVSVALTAFGGNKMGRMIETFKDGLDVGINGGRSYFPKDMPKEKKKKYVDIINIASLDSLAIYYWGTR